MNYRHAYHAGNFADVVKHCLLLQLLAQLGQKDKPYCVFDAYAGSGMYALNSTEAKKTGEAKAGIGKVANLPQADMPEAVASYVRLVARAKKRMGHDAYPGSPWLIAQSLRKHDVAHAFEYQANEYSRLKQLFFKEKRMGVHQRDAFEGVLAMTPPSFKSPTGASPKRGLVLFDPPFESEHKDFGALVRLLSECFVKWSTGIYALWYPIKNRDVVELFYKKMRRAGDKHGIKDMLITELCIYPDDAPIGLNGTGMFIINPPWQFADHADKILQYLLPHLLPAPRKDASQAPFSGSTQVRWIS